MKLVFIILTLVLFLSFFSWVPGVQAEKPELQVILEGGMAIAQGDLGEDFHETALGFGAKNGFEAGFRLRYYLTPSISLSPAFHFLNPGDFSSENDEFGEYSLQANSYRYTVELMVAKSEPYMGFQPFLACGMGIFRNRYQGFTKPSVQEFDRSVNTLGLTGRAGVLVKGFEFSFVYNYNRFSSYQFFDGDQEYDYNWDSMTYRAGWIIPFSSE